MLRVQPGADHLKTFLSSHSKLSDPFIVKDNQIRVIEQMIDEIVLMTFQKSQSFLIILIRKFILQVINRKLSLPLLEEIFQLLKQYESQIKSYKQHLFQLGNIMFQETQWGLNTNTTINQNLESNEDQNLTSLKDSNNATYNAGTKQRFVTWSNLPQPTQDISSQQEDNQLGTSIYKNAKSLSIDIDCYSEDSKHNFMSRYGDKYICSEYLTTSEDENQFTSRSTVLKQFKDQMKSKLKIEPHVSAFNFGLKHKISVDIEQELLQWKRSKNSILQQYSLQKAFAPQDLDDNKLVQKMKQNHYRQKIKSVIVKRRLSTKHLPS